MLRMAEPIIHHRHPEFKEIFSRVNENLKYLFQTQQPVLTLACSGTGGVESTFVSLFSPGDTVIAVNGGKFGERWVKMPRSFGLNAVQIKTDWGKAPKDEQITTALGSHPNAKAVYLVHSETSTGTATDIERLSRVIHDNSDALVCVDGISAIGAHEFRFDQWGIDVCVTGSQKGLMIPPGLAFVAVSKRAIAAMEHSTLPKFYFSLQKALKAHEKNDTPWTPAISLIIGVDTSLKMIREEGIEEIWKRHERLAMALRAGIQAIRLRLFSDSPSFAVTTVWLPDGIEWRAFNTTLKQKYGITIAGGQEEFAGKIFRIAHLGYYDELDIITILSALEMTLHRCGYSLELGKGVAAAQAFFARSV
jgi:aspartate aminotransferase-like enzyme